MFIVYMYNNIIRKYRLYGCIVVSIYGRCLLEFFLYVFYLVFM